MQCVVSYIYIKTMEISKVIGGMCGEGEGLIMANQPLLKLPLVYHGGGMTKKSKNKNWKNFDLNFGFTERGEGHGTTGSQSP